MLDIFKALYNAIIAIFAGEIGDDAEKNDIFSMIKSFFDDMFSKIGA